MMSLTNQTRPILLADKSSQNPIRNSSMFESDSTIGSLIREARKRKGLSQKELALRCDITPVQLCRIENDENIPSRKTLQKLSGHIGIPYDTLLIEAGYNHVSLADSFYRQDGTKLPVDSLVTAIYQTDSELLEYFQDFEVFGTEENVTVLKLILLAMRKEANAEKKSSTKDLMHKHFLSNFQALKNFIVSLLKPILY